MSRRLDRRPFLETGSAAALLCAVGGAKLQNVQDAGMAGWYLVDP